MTPDDVARAIIAEGQRRGVSPRGIQIAIATGMVESNLTVLANEADPPTLQYPHDGLGSDHLSSGVFQQQPGPTWDYEPSWWGTAQCRMDPGCSAGMFFDRLVKMNYNDPNISPGTFAQYVQQSAYPDRYDQRFQDAVAQYDRLTAPPNPNGAPPLTQPPFTETDLTQNNNNDEDRGGYSPRLFILHTEEGCMQGPNFEQWMANNGVSYHYIVNPDGSVDDMETTDVASWSVLDPANEFSINLCFATSSVNWSRQEWLNNMGAGIKSAAWIAVRDCHKYNIPLQILVGPNYPRAVTENGITDHYCITVDRLAPGSTHVDVGPGFPWDTFGGYVQQFSGQPAAPPAPPPPPPPPAPATRTYTVQPGDSLWAIAQQFNVTTDALLAANPSITDADLIFPGQVLSIPLKGAFFN